jgi:uracil-DNA glycosylase
MNAVTNFVAAIRNLSFDNAFNPYSDHCAVHDRPGAAAKRSDALSGILAAAAAGGVHSLWIGRDLGYRGGRRTGLALTDDMHVSVHAARWGVEIARCTKGQAVKERTAALVWQVLERIDLPIFLWNAFPLHPHEPERPFTNRSHRAGERAVGEAMLSELVSLLRPEVVVALGGHAAHSSERIAPKVTVRVRHPSFGGQTQFLSQMWDLYPLSARGMRAGDLFDRSFAP